MKRFICILAAAVLAVAVAASASMAAWTPKADEYWIKVNKQQLRLTLFKGDQTQKSWPVSVGRGNGKVKTSRMDLITPTGTFTIYRVDQDAKKRVFDPAWFNEEGEAKEGVYGTKLISFYNNWQIAIHGTSNPGSIGRHSTHGCIRLRNRDIEELVKFVNPPMKLVITDGDSERRFYKETI